MENTKLEVEMTYVTSASQLLTRQSLTSVKWMSGTIQITDSDMWLPSENGFDIVPLKSIEMIGRNLTGAVRNQILKSAKYSNHLVIDYRKLSKFGIGHITSTMILAGTGENVRKIKNYLVTLLGFTVDAVFGELEPEETSLLCLLATGVNDANILLPVFEGNRILLKHAFMVLKKRKLIDDYASPTQIGLEYVEQVKGKGEGSLGLDIDKAFEDTAKSWNEGDMIKPTARMAKVRWVYEDSTLAGRVAIDALWRFIPIADIKSLAIRELKLGALLLGVYTKHDLSIYIEPAEKSTVYVLQIVLNQNEELQTRILACMYVGINENKIFAYTLNISQNLIDAQLEHMMNKGLIDSDSTLLVKGIETIKNTILNITDGKQDLLGDMTARLERLKIQNVRKTILEKFKDQK